MGLRFFRSIPILPGLRINIGSAGVSLSIGRKGSWVTIGKHGATASVGAPGTGLRLSKKIFKWGKRP